MQSRHNNRELWYAFIAIAGISLAYLVVVLLYQQIPPASNFFGHTIGILGFVLMLMTETLYSLRKRSRSARWGRMSAWLEFHIFTGLVGPYMVLLHTSWKFNGLAGIVMLLTVIIVVSGFIGRYIYTALPRTADGIELEAEELESQIAFADADLKRWLADHTSEDALTLFQRLSKQPELSRSRFQLVFGRSLEELRYRLMWRQTIRKLSISTLAYAKNLKDLLEQKRTLQRQVASLAMARRMLALWHTVHIPIGMALFTAAIVHIFAAIYYATLLR